MLRRPTYGYQGRVRHRNRRASRQIAAGPAIRNQPDRAQPVVLPPNNRFHAVESSLVPLESAEYRGAPDPAGRKAQFQNDSVHIAGPHREIHTAHRHGFAGNQSADRCGKALHPNHQAVHHESWCGQNCQVGLLVDW